MVLQWKPVNGGPFAKLSFMRYWSHACTSLLPAPHTCCHCDTLAERSLCSPGDQFKPWQHHTELGCHLFRGTPQNPICQRASEALCVYVHVWMWVGGKGGAREEVNQELDADGSRRVREWMCGRGAQSLCWFSFFFQDVRRILSFTFPFL